MTHVQLPLLPEWVQFATPWVWALLLLLVVPIYAWVFLRRRRGAVRFPAFRELQAAGAAGHGRRRLLIPLLRSIALVCLVVAVARPENPDERSQVYAEGVALEMVVDVSGSMRELDMSPRPRPKSRLNVVKDVIRDFVNGRENDLIGLIAFGTHPDSLVPLTLDHDALLEAVDDLFVRRHPNEGNTAIGDGLGLAVERMRTVERTAGSGEQLEITSRAIVLLTDGENNTGMISPQQAGQLATELGIKVYTILAGKGTRGAFGMSMPVDDRDLRYIAEITGGKYFRADDEDALREIYEEIDKLERTRTEERRFVQWRSLAEPWLAMALACLVLQAVLEASWLRTIP